MQLQELSGYLRLQYALPVQRLSQISTPSQLKLKPMFPQHRISVNLLKQTPHYIYDLNMTLHWRLRDNFISMLS